MRDCSVTFKTVLGNVTLSYSDSGLTKVRFDETSAAGKKLPVTAPSAPAWVVDAAQRIAQSVAGQATDLADIPLDFSGQPPFFSKVYRAARKISFGKHTTYLELAKKAGSPKASRAVGQAMARNPWLIVVPCHRVLGSGGALGGFSAPGGLTTKRRLLDAEQ